MNYDWGFVSFQFDKQLGIALQQQHLAAQLLALAGRYLVPPKADLSNINMQYSAEKEMLLGNRFENEMYRGLHLFPKLLSVVRCFTKLNRIFVTFNRAINRS